MVMLRCSVAFTFLLGALLAKAQSNISEVEVLANTNEEEEVMKSPNLRGARPAQGGHGPDSSVIHTATAAPKARAADTTTTQVDRRPSIGEQVRIFHISDTHNLHRDLEARFGMPSADILLFTGDFTNKGTDAEIEDFDDWLGTLKGKYRHIFVITGNHDWLDTQFKVAEKVLTPEAALDPKRFQSKLTNAVVLDHQMVEVMGLKIFGSSWCPWASDADPAVPLPTWGYGMLYNHWSSKGGHEHRFGEIPQGADILMTHGPAKAILDGGGWGSSSELFEAVKRAQPRAHLFGHVHEMRGHWQKADQKSWQGGVEYEVPGVGKLFAKDLAGSAPPATNYPVQHVSNSAVLNNAGLDGTNSHIAGPGRLISATLGPDGWQIKQL